MQQSIVVEKNNCQRQSKCCTVTSVNNGIRCSVTWHVIYCLGNMLLNYESDILLKMIKFGFALSVVVGFPLMIYPCRQSIFTLFLQKSIKYTSLNDSDSTYIPPSGK